MLSVNSALRARNIMQIFALPYKGMAVLMCASRAGRTARACAQAGGLRAQCLTGPQGPRQFRHMDEFRPVCSNRFWNINAKQRYDHRKPGRCSWVNIGPGKGRGL
eukprot:4674968-Alexandrium_andersonii.AAC.1